MYTLETYNNKMYSILTYEHNSRIFYLMHLIFYLLYRCHLRFCLNLGLGWVRLGRVRLALDGLIHQNQEPHAAAARSARQCYSGRGLLMKVSKRTTFKNLYTVVYGAPEREN
jgi:hypothetical protein